MPFTFGKFKEIIAPYAGTAGKCASSDEVAFFARGVMEYLLFEGSTSALRKLDIYAYQGSMVFPPEVEVPLKVKVNGQVSEVWNKWCTIENSGAGDFEGADCRLAREVIAEDGGFTPLAYPVPPQGSLLGVMAICEEAEEARVIMSGEDLTGREIYTVNDKGEQIVGEEYRLIKNEIRFGRVKFGRVTAAQKPITNGYVQVFAVDPSCDKRIFLGDWRPSEQVPFYRKWKVIGPRCAPIVHLSIQFRAKLKDSYHDNELTLFDNYTATLMAAQRLQAEKNNDLEVASYKTGAITTTLNNEAGYKKKGAGPIHVLAAMSGGSIRNIVGRRFRNWTGRV